MFADRVKIKARGGNGGRGCASFHREKYRPKMGPDGGDGGRGGDVILEVEGNISSLAPLRYKSHFEAEHGHNGQGSDRHGRGGADTIIAVPPGTVVFALDDDDEAGAVVADLVNVGDRFLAAKGGSGGRGNTHFVTSTNRAPRICEEGIEGQEHRYLLELKTVADVGLVGYPNAGKSTLLRAVSNAEPEVAPYPFTTLTPHVGMVEFPDYYRLTVADIPGLIDGASENVGLGHHFLRHVERTKILVYVLDIPGVDGRDCWTDLEHLKHELEAYQAGLSDRPALIAANKMDEPAAEEKLATLRTYTSLPIFPIIAELGEGIDPLLAAIRQRVEHLRIGHHPEEV